MTRHKLGIWPRTMGKHIDVSNWPVTEKSKPKVLKPELLFFTMCSSASELMHHKPKEGDRYIHPDGKIVIVSSYCIQVPDNQGRISFAIAPKFAAIHFDETKPDFGSPTYKKMEFKRHPLEYLVWLPRIAQFQEMLQPLSVMTMLHLFYGFVQQGKGHWHSFENAPFPDPTMEQLWMCFTWKQLYDKFWTDPTKGWVR